MGSIAAGGRYDNLVGIFSPSGSQQTPCVGVSLGVERIFTIIEHKIAASDLLRKTSVTQVPHSSIFMHFLYLIQVYVASIGPHLMSSKMKVANILWRANICTEFSSYENPKFKKQLEEALDRNIPIMVIVGEDEIARNEVKVKDLVNHVEKEVPLQDLVQSVLTLGAYRSTLIDNLKLLPALK